MCFKHGQTFSMSNKIQNVSHSFPLTGGSPVMAPKRSAPPSDKGSVPLKANLLQFRKNVSDLRMQLHQMRQQQVRSCLLDYFFLS